MDVKARPPPKGKSVSETIMDYPVCESRRKEPQHAVSSGIAVLRAIVNICWSETGALIRLNLLEYYTS